MVSVVDRCVREKVRLAITGVPRVTWWRYEKQGIAPKRLILGVKNIGWRMSELQAWVASRTPPGQE